MTQARAAGGFAQIAAMGPDGDRPPQGDGGNSPSVANDFARLRTRLLALLDGLARPEDAPTDALRAQLGLSERAFGELWAACCCNGDLPRQGRAKAG
jgi:hypothetical protein